MAPEQFGDYICEMKRDIKQLLIRQAQTGELLKTKVEQYDAQIGALFTAVAHDRDRIEKIEKRVLAYAAVLGVGLFILQIAGPSLVKHWLGGGA